MRHDNTREVELERLGAIFDPLMAGRPIGEEALSELLAMARIFDLDDTAPPADIWRDVRAVLRRNSGPFEGETSPGEPESPPLTIMVVEDDPDMAQGLADVLADAGHEVVGPFSNAAAAAASIQWQAVDLALLDINLADGEEGGGVGLARMLKTNWGVPSIFTSGDVTRAARHARLASALVLKPYRGGDVLSAISRVVRRGVVAT